MSNIPWINTVAGSPLRLRHPKDDEQLTWPDVPGDVLGSAPSGCTWIGGSGRRWVACFGERGPDEALIRFDGERWLDTGVHGVGWSCPDADGRLVVGRESLFDVGLEPQDATRPLLVCAERIFCSAYLGDALVLVSKDRLTHVSGERVRSWAFESDLVAVRAVDGALLVGEQISVDGPPHTKDIVHVVVITDEAAYRVGRFQSTDAAGEWGHSMSIDVEYVGPHEGRFAGITKGSPLRGPVMLNDGQPLVIERLAAAVAKATKFDRLEPTEPLALSFDVPPPIAPTPLESRRLELEQPDRASLGPLGAWLIDKMQKLGRRPQPDPDVLALLNHPMPADLFAFLHTWAHYRVSVVFDNIDWWVDPKPQRVSGWLAGSAPMAVQIGTMGSGDPFVVQLFDDGRARFTNFDDEGCEYFTASSLEGLLLNLRSETQIRGETTLLDGL